MKKKVLHFQMALSKVEVRGDAIDIEGYASTPTIDRYNSIIAIESFNEGMENYRKNPVILLGHDDTKPIGTCDEYKVDDKGLWIKASITKNTEGVFEDIKEGRTKGFSIGFIPLAWFYIDKVSGKNLTEMTEEEYSKVDYNNIVRVINNIDLVEISVVNVPANPQALFTISKALRSFFTEVETRSVVDMQRRELIMPEDNPFIDQPELKEEVVEEKPEEVIEEPKPEEVKEEEKPVEGTDPKSDTAVDEPQEEGEEPGETPEAPQEQAQTVEELKAKLEEERKLNEELMGLLEQVENLKKELANKPVNKPVIYTQQAPKQEDPFVTGLHKAKYGK